MFNAREAKRVANAAAKKKQDSLVESQIDKAINRIKDAAEDGEHALIFGEFSNDTFWYEGTRDRTEAWEQCCGILTSTYEFDVQVTQVSSTSEQFELSHDATLVSWK